MAKKILTVGSELTSNWPAKCKILKEKYPRLTDGDLTFEEDEPGSEGKMFDNLCVKTGLSLDSLHQLVLNLLKGKVNVKYDVDPNPLLKTKEAKEKITEQPDINRVNIDHSGETVKPDIEKEVNPKPELTPDKPTTTEEEFRIKKEKLLAEFSGLEEDDLEYNSNNLESFEDMLENVADILFLTRDELVVTINDL